MKWIRKGVEEKTNISILCRKRREKTKKKTKKRDDREIIRSFKQLRFFPYHRKKHGPPRGEMAGKPYLGVPELILSKKRKKISCGPSGALF